MKTGAIRCLLTIGACSLGLIMSSRADAHQYEFGVRVCNSQDISVAGHDVYLYFQDDLTAPYRQGVTDTSTENLLCDIIPSDNTPNPTWAPIKAAKYYLRVDDWYILVNMGDEDGDLKLKLYVFRPFWTTWGLS